jgi:hypothetical protein
VGSVGQELLPEALLGLPQVRRLPGEGGAMYPQEVREEVGVVAPEEVRKEFCVLVYPQELTDDLDGDDLGVEECWGRSACSETPEVRESIVSMRQKTATMKVLRSTRAKTSFSLR